MKRIHWWCYDDSDMPGLGGGGAALCREVVKRLAPKWDITVYHGNYQHARACPWYGAWFVPIGFVRFSRLWFALCGTFGSLCSGAEVRVFEFSAYAPVMGFLRPRGAVVLFYHRIPAWKYGPLSALPRAAEWLALRVPEWYMVLSDAMRMSIEMQRGRGAKASVAYPGVSSERPIDTRKEKYILFLGRFDAHQKGIDTLLDAWKVANSLCGGLSLVFLGRGTQPQIDYITSRGTNLMVVEERQGTRPLWLSESAFAVFPSRYEGFCMAAIECQAHGVPVVVSSIPAFTEATKPGCTSYVFSAGRADQLAFAMWKMSTNHLMRKTMGDNAREWAKSFTWEACSERHDFLFNEMLYLQEATRRAGKTDPTAATRKV